MIERIPESPPVILPVASNENRPQWSVMIPAYNCMAFLRATMECVLAQDPGIANMQIEVVDDCSTDGDVRALVEEVGKGRILYYRQPQNSGSLRNFETCLNRSRGHWVHLLHGDDVVKPGFYAEIEYMFNKFPDVGAAFTKYTHINAQGVELKPGDGVLLEEPGVLDDFLLKIAQGQHLQPPAIVVKRMVYEKLGGFFAVHYGEDWEMWIRIAAHFKFAYSPKCLALYRSGHLSNITSLSISSGQNIKDIIKVVNICQAYLPADKRRAIKLKAMRHFSIHYAMASTWIYPKEKKAAFIQARGALKMDWNLRTFYWIFRLSLLHARSLVGLPPAKPKH